MTPAEESYNKVMLWIDGCDSFFDLKCADRMVDLFGDFYKDSSRAKEMLKDLKADKYQEIFNHGKNKIHN